MQKYGRYAALFFILCGIAIAVYSYHTLKTGELTMPDAGLMPFIVGIGLVILGAIWFFTQKKLETGEEKKVFAELWYRPVIAVGLMIAYGWAMEAWGYMLSTLAFMLVWQIVLERAKWVQILSVAILGTAAMYFLFGYFLKVPVPKEFFMR